MTKLDRSIEAISNAIELLESLGYKSGDIHDDLKEALGYCQQRKAAWGRMREAGERYSKGLPPEVRLP